MLAFPSYRFFLKFVIWQICFYLDLYLKYFKENCKPLWIFHSEKQYKNNLIKNNEYSVSKYYLDSWKKLVNISCILFLTFYTQILT